MIERELEEMPFDMRFTTEDGNDQLCHATGIEVCFDGDDPSDIANWWNEYIDTEGNYHYGR